MQEPILQAKHVVFRSILRYPDVTIYPGEATFLQGPSGSGKSTLLTLFNATQSPDSGAVHFHGQDVASLDSIALRRAVLLAGQSVYLFRGSVAENFAAFRRYLDLPSLSPEEISRLLTLCCADFPLDASCDTMSGGERQRVYLAVALSLNPAVLMLDEPTSALDSATAQQLLSQLKAHCTQAGITLLVVCHTPELVSRFADRVISLSREVNV